MSVKPILTPPPVEQVTVYHLAGRKMGGKDKECNTKDHPRPGRKTFQPTPPVAYQPAPVARCFLSPPTVGTGRSIASNKDDIHMPFPKANMTTSTGLK